jgi:hypothetical protein
MGSINTSNVLDFDDEKINIYLRILYPPSDSLIIRKAYFNLKLAQGNGCTELIITGAAYLLA